MSWPLTTSVDFYYAPLLAYYVTWPEPWTGDFKAPITEIVDIGQYETATLTLSLDSRTPETGPTGGRLDFEGFLTGNRGQDRIELGMFAF